MKFGIAAKLLIVASVVLSCGEPVGAWGRVGHRVSVAIAESLLTAEARGAIRALLGRERLVDASTWADEQRDIPGSAGWHFVNVPISAPRYDPAFCPPTGCVVSKIQDFRRILLDLSRPRSERVAALRFLIHLIPDLHQPLHVGGRWDRGGNDLQVRFLGIGTNLHHVWDFQIMEHYSVDEPVWFRLVKSAIGRNGISEWSRGNEIDWANESLDIARSAYKYPGSGAPLRPGARLAESYYDFGLPIVQQRLAQAAVRLAAVLNELGQH